MATCPCAITLSNSMDTTLQSRLMKSCTLFAKTSICCVCFLCENLSEYEGFRSWQRFIFVEIFVIEFLLK